MIADGCGSGNVCGPSVLIEPGRPLVEPTAAHLVRERHPGHKQPPLSRHQSFAAPERDPQSVKRRRLRRQSCGCPIQHRRTFLIRACVANFVLRRRGTPAGVLGGWLRGTRSTRFFDSDERGWPARQKPGNPPRHRQPTLEPESPRQWWGETSERSDLLAARIRRVVLPRGTAARCPRAGCRFGSTTSNFVRCLPA